MSCLNLARVASALGDLLWTGWFNWSVPDVGVKATSRPLAVAAADLLRGSMTPFTICTLGLPRLAKRRRRRLHCSCGGRQRTASAGPPGRSTLRTYCEPADCLIGNVYSFNGSSVLSS